MENYLKDECLVVFNSKIGKTKRLAEYLAYFINEINEKPEEFTYVIERNIVILKGPNASNLVKNICKDCEGTKPKPLPSGGTGGLPKQTIEAECFILVKNYNFDGKPFPNRAFKL